MAALSTALVLGGTALAGAAVASSAAKNAAKTNAAAANQASDASLQAAREAAQSARETSAQNNALLKEIFGQNSATLNPFIKTGGAAQDAINAFLGLPTYKTETTSDYEAYVNDNADILANFEKYGDQFGGDKAAFGKWFSDLYGDMNPAKLATESRQVLDTEAPARQAQAFDNFRNATGYQDQLAQGVAAIDQSAAARGGLNSGGTLKALQRYGTGLASQSAGQYLNYLTGQQSVGANAANALTGVGNAYATNVAANNTSANNAASNALLGATGASNSYLTGAANTNANAGLASANALTNLLGQGVGAYGAYKGSQGLGTSSYGMPTASPAPSIFSNPGYGLNTAFA